MIDKHVQPDLFSEKTSEESAPFQRHSLSSKQAASQIQESANTLRAKLFRFIRDCGVQVAGQTFEVEQRKVSASKIAQALLNAAIDDAYALLPQ
jgi:hypothetical protein